MRITCPACESEFELELSDSELSSIIAYLAKIGRKGGQAKTEVKRKASRQNGKKGGRPKRKEIL